MWKPFFNKVLRILLFLPEGMKIDFENTNRTSHVQAVKWRKPAKVRDQAFLAARLSPSPNASIIIAHPGSDAYSEESVQDWVIMSSQVRQVAKTFATWQTVYRFGRALSPVPARLSFRQCAYAFMTLQSLCYNCERGNARDLRFQNPTQGWVPHILSDPQKTKKVEASAELIQILNHLEADSFDGFLTGNESWFQYPY
jgi:hypothetical protein